MTTDENEVSTLVRNAVEVINEVIALNRDLKPYKDIVLAYDKPAGKQGIGIAVYSDDPDEARDRFTLCLREGKLEVVAEGKGQTSFAWKVTPDYLRQIVDNRDEYVQHPENLDLDWLKRCLGVPLEREEQREDAPSRLAREREIEKRKNRDRS
jgi:hypothetical protein